MSTDGTILFDDVVRLIVERDYRSHDTLKSATERASKRLRYAIENQTIKGEGGAEKLRILERPDGLLRFHVILWLKQKYPGLFDDLPDISYGDITCPICITVTAPIPEKPDSIEEAYASMLAMHGEIQDLKAQVRSLEPDATAWRQFKEKNRESGRLGGRKRKARES